MQVVNIFTSALQQFVMQIVAFLPKLIIAILIWFIGKYLLNLGVKLLTKIDIPGTKLGKRMSEFLTKITLPIGKIILILIILDYLGIGQTVIGAFTNGLSFTIAIALGLAFGKALEKDATELIGEAKKYFGK